MSAPKNYLSRLAGEDQRNHKRRLTNTAGTIYYLRRGVRGFTSQPCRMMNISESGCLVAVPLPGQVGDHLYLVLDGMQMKISCAAVARSETALHLRFSTDMPSELVNKIARRKFAPCRHANDP